MPHLVEILIATSPTDPMVPQTSVRAIPGRGLVGDRYFLGTGTFSPQPQKPDFEITLIQQEHIAAFAARSGLPFTAREARRNLVTTGIDLNTLVGHEFMVGSVKMRGLRLCEPCNYLAKQTSPEVLPGLVHQGGLRAQILTEGDIRAGDALTPLLHNS
ncbi:MAG: MOSC domain-containing protein [Verrucomicrobiota bacterium]